MLWMKCYNTKVKFQYSGRILSHMVYGVLLVICVNFRVLSIIDAAFLKKMSAFKWPLEQEELMVKVKVNCQARRGLAKCWGFFLTERHVKAVKKFMSGNVGNVMTKTFIGKEAFIYLTDV